MSDPLIMLVCAGCGLLARLVFLPASIAAKKRSFAVTFVVDALAALVGGIPFAAAVFILRDGVHEYFTFAGFYAGLLLPSLLLRLAAPILSRLKKSARRGETGSFPRP